MGAFYVRNSGPSYLRPSSSPDYARYYAYPAGWHVYVNGSDDITRLDITQLRITDSGPNAASKLTAYHVDYAKAFAIPARALVEMITDAGIVYWTGRVTGRKRVPLGAGGFVFDIEATDLSPDLDASWIISDSTPAGWSDREVIRYLVAKYAYTGISAPDRTVAVTNAAMPALTFTKVTLRQALTQAAGAAGTNQTWWVDAQSRINYGLAELTPAPYAFSDTPNLTTTLPYQGGPPTHESDESGIFNAVYVEGPTDETTGLPVASGWVEDAASIALYGRRETTLQNDDATTPEKVNLYGSAYLGKVKDPVVRGSLGVTGYHGWAAGQALTLTSSQLGLSAQVFMVSQVETAFLDGTGRRAYTISYGDLPKSLVREIASTVA